MAEHTVVVVGSNQPLPEYTPGNFWVIDFSNAAAPTAVSVSCSSSGVVVDCSGSMAAVAAVSGDTVTIYDIANPASPAATGSASLSFNGIGAISFYGGYVLVGEASNDSGARVALIDISNLASPQVYATSFAQITDVTLFGSTAVICGLGGYSNAFQVATTSDFPLLATSVPMTDVSAWIEYSISFMCDFDGTNAVFSDGTSLYAYGISGGVAALLPSQPGGGGGITSVAVAENAGAAAGVQLAYAAAANPNVELLYAGSPVSSASTWASSSRSLGDPNNSYGQPIDFEGGVAKFCRTITGASAVLATAGVTQIAGGGTQECVVSLFDVKAGGGSITATRQGARSAVALPNTTSPNNTLGVTVFYTWWPIWPIPWRIIASLWARLFG
jgi:LVIVD repeat